MASTTRPYGGVSADERRAERRARLIEAGLELLGERGWAGTTVRGVCAEAGLSERYFYENFGDRDRLLAAIFDRVAAEAARGIVAAVEAAPHEADAKARAAIDAFVRLLAEDPRRARAMLVESLGNEALQERREEAFRSFAALISERARSFFGADAVAEVDAELTSVALVGGLAELVIRWLDGSLAVSRERLVDHCAKLFVASAQITSRR